MELHVTGELEAKLTHSAAQQGRDPEELAQDVDAPFRGRIPLSRGGEARRGRLATWRAPYA